MFFCVIGVTGHSFKAPENSVTPGPSLPSRIHIWGTASYGQHPACVLLGSERLACTHI